MDIIINMKRIYSEIQIVICDKYSISMCCRLFSILRPVPQPHRARTGRKRLRKAKKIWRYEMQLCIDVCVVGWWLLASMRSRISYVITSSCNPKPNAEYVWMNHVPFHIYVHGLFNSLGTGLMSLSRYVPQHRTNSKCVSVICVYIRFQWTCNRTVIYHFFNANQILNRPNW